MFLLYITHHGGSISHLIPYFPFEESYQRPSNSILLAKIATPLKSSMPKNSSLRTVMGYSFPEKGSRIQPTTMTHPIKNAQYVCNWQLWSTHHLPLSEWPPSGNGGQDASDLLPEEVTHGHANAAVFRDEREVFQTIKRNLTVVKMRIMMLMIRDTLKSISGSKESPMDTEAPWDMPSQGKAEAFPASQNTEHPHTHLGAAWGTADKRPLLLQIHLGFLINLKD